MKVRIWLTVPACVVMDVSDDDPDTLYDALADMDKEGIGLAWDEADIFDYAPVE